MIDWNALVLAPVAGIFGQAVDYTPAGGQTVRLENAIFSEPYVSVDPLGQPGVASTQPRLGLQVSLMPAGWDAINAQGDTFTVVATGKSYTVNSGQPDSKGWAHLTANDA